MPLAPVCKCTFIRYGPVIVHTGNILVLRSTVLVSCRKGKGAVFILKIKLKLYELPLTFGSAFFGIHNAPMYVFGTFGCYKHTDVLFTCRLLGVIMPGIGKPDGLLRLVLRGVYVNVNICLCAPRKCNGRNNSDNRCFCFIHFILHSFKYLLVYHTCLQLDKDCIICFKFNTF